MEPDTSKARLRASVRARRSRRITDDLAEATSGSDSGAEDSSVVDSPAEATAGSTSDLGSSSSVGEPSVARTALGVVADLWPGDDLTGRTVVAYAALRGEPDLDPFIDDVRRRGARVFLPVVTRVGEALKFGEVTDPMTTLAPQGKWGIREPEPQLSATDLFAEAAPDLVLVPALGFGAGGARLGNGGGFYDRTFGPLGEVPITDGARVIGVCFADEVDLPGLSVEPWDLHIAEVITEHGLRRL